MAKSPKLDATRKFPMRVPDGKGGTVEVKQVVHLNQVIDHPRIEIGDFSYYHNFLELGDYASAIAPYLFPLSPEKLTIGKFCQLAHGVRFITSSANHDMRGPSTYPFANFMLDQETSEEEFSELFQVSSTKGDTRIGNDVWLGMDAVVMPGVTVGDGAIVGARSVVLRDVEPYTIVGGNPAIKRKRRFSLPAIEQLLTIQWWNWPIEKIEENLRLIVAGDVQDLAKIA